MFYVSHFWLEYNDFVYRYFYHRLNVISDDISYEKWFLSKTTVW